MIGQQRLGVAASITPDTGIPTGNEANRLVLASTWNANLLPTCWILGVQITNVQSPQIAFEADLYLWGRDAQQSLWGRLGENEGQLNAGTTFQGTAGDGWWFVFQNLEVWQDLYIQQANLVGSPTITCSLYPMYEQAVELRGL